MKQMVHDLREYKEFLREYILQQIRARYQGSVLGFVWTLLNPLFVSHWDLSLLT